MATTLSVAAMGALLAMANLTWAFGAGPGLVSAVQVPAIVGYISRAALRHDLAQRSAGRLQLNQGRPTAARCGKGPHEGGCRQFPARAPQRPRAKASRLGAFTRHQLPAQSVT